MKQIRLYCVFLLVLLLNLVHAENCVTNLSAGPYAIFIVDETPVTDVFVLCNDGGYLNRLAGYIVCTEASGCNVYDNIPFKNPEIISILNLMNRKHELSRTNICKDYISRISFTPNSTWLNNVEIDFYKGYYYHPATNFLAVWGIENYVNLALQGILQEQRLSDGREYVTFNHNHKSYNLQLFRQVNEHLWESDQRRVMINKTDSNDIYVDEYYLDNLIQSAPSKQCFFKQSYVTSTQNKTSSHNENSTGLIELFLYISIAINLLLACLLLILCLCKRDTFRKRASKQLHCANVPTKIKEADHYMEPIRFMKYHTVDRRVSKEYVVFAKDNKSDCLYEELVHPSMIDSGYI